MRKMIGQLAGGIAVAAAMLCNAQISSAQSLGADTIALFPKNVGEFAYANLKQARSQKWFPQLQEQMLPERFKQFEKFLASAGVDPNSQVEELAWGLVAEGVTDKTSGTGSGVELAREICSFCFWIRTPLSLGTGASWRRCWTCAMAERKACCTTTKC